jgi:hypothetical protein
MTGTQYPAALLGGAGRRRGRRPGGVPRLPAPPDRGEYRECFGLGRSTPLCAPAVLARRRELGLDRYAGNSRLRAGLAIGQTMARSGELLELSHTGQPAGSARLQSRRRAGERTEPTRTRTKEQAQQSAGGPARQARLSGRPAGLPASALPRAGLAGAARRPRAGHRQHGHQARARPGRRGPPPTRWRRNRPSPMAPYHLAPAYREYCSDRCSGTPATLRGPAASRRQPGSVEGRLRYGRTTEETAPDPPATAPRRNAHTRRPAAFVWLGSRGLACRVKDRI